MTSRVSVGVRVGYSSRGTRRPRIRTVGGAPAVRWRSDARRSRTSSNRSAKSKSIVARVIGSPARFLPQPAKRLDALLPAPLVSWLVVVSPVDGVRHGGAGRPLAQVGDRVADIVRQRVGELARLVDLDEDADDPLVVVGGRKRI